MQFDLFHVYTVDEHILMVIRNLRRFALPQHRDECPRCHEVFHRLPKPALLYLSGLFHDIAKGRGGDHSELGAEDALRFCERHDLPPFDAKLVAWLVRMHLVMSHTAQQKDIDDPAVVRDFAARVATRMRLDYLYLLTVADMRGTNPARWNSWKGALLDRLHQLTMEALERGLDQPQRPDDIIEQRQAEARDLLNASGYPDDQINLQWMTLSTDYFLQNTVDAITWHTELLWPPGRRFDQLRVAMRADEVNRCTDVFVYGPDRDDLFAHTTALLDQLGLNVLSARVQTTDAGVSLSTYLVLEDDGSEIDGDERGENIRLYIEENLNGSERPLGRPRMPRHLKSFQTASQVAFQQDESRVLTLIELQTSDRPGLLSLIGQAFSENRLRLHSARIATAGAEARDVFAVTDRDNHPIVDSAHLDAIARSLKDRLDT
jgi:[protein-PII] uridylyltransferase